MNLNISHEENPCRCVAVRDTLAERQYQDEKWGGSSRDDVNTEDEWVAFINEYTNKQGRAAYYDFRKRMVKVAAIESHDRKSTI